MTVQKQLCTTVSNQRRKRLVAALVTIALSPLAHATLQLDYGVGAAPTGAHYANFNDLTVAGGATGGLTVTFGSGSGINGGAAPYLSNGNGALFGDPTVSGPDRTTWLNAGGTITLTLPGPQKYFGILWGSIDSSNSLSFYATDNTLVGTVVGNDIIANANGNQGAQGTYYLNVDSTIAFAYVIANGGGTPMEFDNVSYNDSIPGVLEPSGAALALAGLLAVGFLGRARGVPRATRRVKG